MWFGGPRLWSSKPARAQAPEARFASRPARVIVRLLAVGLVVGVFAGPSLWHSSASAQQAQPSLAVTRALRAEPASRVRLPIQVGPPAALSKNNFIRIRGLPPAAALSDGHVIAAGAWAVPLVALPTLTITLPAGVQGESTVAISLVSIDGDVLAETTMVLAISAPAPPPAPAPAPVTQLSQPPAQLGAPPPRAGPATLPLSSAERERAFGLHAKGVEQLERGNVFAARKFFERAAEAGLAQSAVALAGTYDPEELSKMRVVGLQPNVEEARKWYEKARELGAVEAAERLRRMGAR
jgi:hypothetical protein